MHISFNFYFYLFLHSWLCVTNFFPFLLDIGLIVAWYSVSIVSHIKEKKYVSYINLRKIILKFYHAITK